MDIGAEWMLSNKEMALIVPIPDYYLVNNPKPLLYVGRSTMDLNLIMGRHLDYLHTIIYNPSTKGSQANSWQSLS